MKKTIFSKIFFLIALCLLAIFPRVVEAHVLETDGDIGAVLHIDPDDDPIAGSAANFFFEFKDRTSKFQPQNCDCTVVVDEGGNQIYAQSLFQNNGSPSLENASFSYAFPKKDVYQVKVIGKPLTPNSFQAFTLSYNIRVARQANDIPTGQTADSGSGNWFSVHLSHIVWILVGVFLIGFVIIKRR